MLPIFSHPPGNWKDLQEKVAKIFSDMGYNISIEKDIETVRGKVNVDVLATKKNHRLTEVVIVECKQWSRKVTKSTIHAFRTVVSDYGANTGLIISKNGFQLGAYEAAKMSNIQLFTFDEFQNEFRQQWLDEVIDRNAKTVYPLRRYCDYLESFLDVYIDALPIEKQKKISYLRNYYDTTSGLASRVFYKGVMDNIIHKHIDKVILKYYNDLPLTQPESLLAYFDYIYNFSIEGINAFDVLFDKKIRKWD